MTCGKHRRKNSSDVKFMNLAPYVFDLDHVAKIRSGLYITVLEKKKSTRISPRKVTLKATYYSNKIEILFSKTAGKPHACGAAFKSKTKRSLDQLIKSNGSNLSPGTCTG